jgi:hypothetical protein
MDMYATTIYVISDEVLKLLEIKDDPQSHMSNAEVITVVSDPLKEVLVEVLVAIMVLGITLKKHTPQSKQI